jgi:hypothetical protein
MHRLQYEHLVFAERDRQSAGLTARELMTLPWQSAKIGQRARSEKVCEPRHQFARARKPVNASEGCLGLALPLEFRIGEKDFHAPPGQVRTCTR